MSTGRTSPGRGRLRPLRPGASRRARGAGALGPAQERQTEAQRRQRPRPEQTPPATRRGSDEPGTNGRRRPPRASGRRRPRPGAGASNRGAAPATTSTRADVATGDAAGGERRRCRDRRSRPQAPSRAPFEPPPPRRHDRGTVSKTGAPGERRRPVGGAGGDPTGPAPAGASNRGAAPATTSTRADATGDAARACDEASRTNRRSEAPPERAGRTRRPGAGPAPPCAQGAGALGPAKERQTGRGPAATSTGADATGDAAR